MPKNQPTQLPKPTNDALAHSQQLTDHIVQSIDEHGGKISFAHFMQLALYAPGLGYYSAGANKLGPSGDFITAPELSPLFAQCLAKQCAEVFNEISPADILELGAGSGVMAADILSYLKSTDRLPRHYFILEVSADLKQRQLERLTSAHPDFIDHIIWLNELPEKFNGIIIANEVLDAIPVHVFHWENDHLQENYITFENDQFNWTLGPASDVLAASFDYLKNNTDTSAWKTPYCSEINTILSPWVKSISQCLESGVILFIDYGFSQSVYYHPQRKTGTIMCHYQHHAHTDPLTLVGLQDITAHVDFTAVTQSAVENGLLLEGFLTQANFLLNCEIDKLLEKIDDPSKKHNAKQAVKKLILPTEMGELFKVIGFSKNFEAELSGFSNFDMSFKL